MSRRRTARGFTLMEILISMTVLMIGMLPMLAVFKTALNNLNRSIEDTYASAIAQSVIDAIRMGLREMKVDHGAAGKFFIFDHEGSADIDEDRKTLLRDMDITLAGNMPRLLARDYCILLPRKDETDTAMGTSKPIGAAFLFPRKNTTDNGNRKRAEHVQQRVGTVVGRKVKVEKTYQLGKKLRESSIAIEQNDTLAQYSFAFTIRAAKAPDPLAPNADVKQQDIADGLFEVVVMVYRNFNPDPNAPKNDTVGGPGREFITYIAE